MPCAYSKKYKYIIIYSAKCGCTFFRKLFLELHKDELKGTPTNKWHTLNNDFPIPKNLNNIPKIYLTRNPYTRLVSIFCNKYCGGINKWCLSTKFKLKKVTFREFVIKLCNFKKKKKLNSIDIHINEQSCHFNNNNIHILKLEDFDKSIVDIYSKLGLTTLIQNINLYIIRGNINKTIKNKETEYVYDKEYNINNRIFPEYKYFYDKELLELVYNLYKDDFINFGYNKYQLD